jgi:hypothetical protein
MQLGFFFSKFEIPIKNSANQPKESQIYNRKNKIKQFNFCCWKNDKIVEKNHCF